MPGWDTSAHPIRVPAVVVKEGWLVLTTSTPGSSIKINFNKHNKYGQIISYNLNKKKFHVGK
jgi:cell wall assembly regulator SMI1